MIVSDSFYPCDIYESQWAMRLNFELTWAAWASLEVPTIKTLYCYTKNEERRGDGYDLAEE